MRGANRLALIAPISPPPGAWMTTPSEELPQLRLEPRSDEPLQRQLYRQLRALILEGVLPSGARLPPTRELSRTLGVSRNTVMHAYEHLQVEGYLAARVGSGTRVVETLPDRLFTPRHEVPPRQTSAPPPPPPPPLRLSRRGERLAATPVSPTLYRNTPGPFRPGAVAADHFPAREWARLLGRTVRRGGASLASYGDSQGHTGLREAIAEYLRRSRGVRCGADQILVTSGSQQALDLTARLLVDVGEGVGIEDPCYLGARAAFAASRPEFIPLPVEPEGISTSAIDERRDRLRVLYTTPSHQYPLGITMTASRRLELLAYARSHQAWLLEDDYDSEFRYDTHPVTSLQGLDDGGRVLYVGTFSKMLSPAFRLGYLVLPEVLVKPFTRAREVMDHHPPIVTQATLEVFIREGQLERHIRRMRTVYKDRRDTFRDCVGRRLDGALHLGPMDAGIHVVGWLAQDLDEDVVSREAGLLGVDAPPLGEHYFAGRGPRPGVVLGFGAVDPDRMPEAVDLLAQAIEASTR